MECTSNVNPHNNIQTPNKLDNDTLNVYDNHVSTSLLILADASVTLEEQIYEQDYRN